MQDGTSDIHRFINQNERANYYWLEIWRDQEKAETALKK